MNPFLGEIRLFAGSFAPYGWAFCNGAIMPVRSNTALFSIIGNVYGGDGVQTFALPDLQGKVPVGAGTGPRTSPRRNGDTGGALTHQISPTENALHNHPVACFASNGSTTVAVANFFANSVTNRETHVAIDTPYESTANASDSTMNATILSTFGVAEPSAVQTHSNIQPYLGMNFIIATSGVFPPRS